MLTLPALAAGSYRSMYVRLGGYAGVHSLSRNLVNRLAGDPLLTRYFTGVSAGQREALATYAADYACKEADASCRPVAPDVSLITNPPSLSRAQVRAAIHDFQATLQAHGVPPDVQSRLLHLL